MKFLFKSRIRALALVSTLASAITLGLAGSATASSVPAWQLQVCSKSIFQTNVYWGNGGFMGVPAGQCQTAYWQRTSDSVYMVHVDAYVNGGGYIASADVNIAEGAGLASGGVTAPYLWSF
ncbi:hypothetical protein OG585_49740 (plasmid) [Streptomyces sp. NBC_01340]|uniref:hypothetical protein n=1 Tax=unclassified Streptomyces TaxID=2593676 RepID=UPI00224CD203|nr:MULTISPECIES: hypothetical protein [unclassified Streptomyces]MCX4460771.1 hypothetical protein [Streptomyces sp. NBC_01719]MCX4499899.1 hypothetical protein [Streptomyces sp. NBC_01728]WSI45024.1 hypothetical protein OG585_49740 [Streptomyces sp. NBC_01340]